MYLSTNNIWLSLNSLIDKCIFFSIKQKKYIITKGYLLPKNARKSNREIIIESWIREISGKWFKKLRISDFKWKGLGKERV